MVSVKRSTNTGRLSSSVIPITDIERTCHLVPDFGKAIPENWTSSNVLDIAKAFYINPYLRHRDFYILRYCMYLQEKREREQQANLEQRRAKRAR
jgi:hypothetical protein